MNERLRVIVVDDDEESRLAVSKFLQFAWNCEVIEYNNATDALAGFKKNPTTVIISDIRMPVMSGVDFLSEIKKTPESDRIAFVLMTGFADKDSAIRALRNGAYDYLEKPVDAVTLTDLMNRIRNDQLKHFDNENTRIEESSKKRKIKKSFVSDKKLQIKIPDYGTIGVFSIISQNVVDLALKAHEDRSIPVLIQGDTGTGKEAIARMIHHGLGRSKAPFISINCPAISPGLFESELFGYEEGAFTGANKMGTIGKLELAQEGSIFLDEIGDLPLEMQPKLLRVLEEREMYRVGGIKKVNLNVRIIAATNHNLAEKIDERKFRSDLFHRMSVGLIRLLPLKERPDEIIPLAQFFLDNLAREKKSQFRYIDQETRNILRDYPWPGNIRELRNAIERVILIHDEEILRSEHINFLFDTQDHSPKQSQGILVPGRITLPEENFNLKQLEDEIIRKALRKFHGNKTKAAKYLGISRNTMINRSQNL